MRILILGLIFGYGLGLIFDAVNLAPFPFYRLMVGINGFFIVVQSVLLLAGFIPESPNSLLAKH